MSINIDQKTCNVQVVNTVNAYKLQEQKLLEKGINELLQKHVTFFSSGVEGDVMILIPRCNIRLIHFTSPVQDNFSLTTLKHETNLSSIRHLVFKKFSMGAKNPRGGSQILLNESYITITMDFLHASTHAFTLVKLDVLLKGCKFNVPCWTGSDIHNPHNLNIETCM